MNKLNTFSNFSLLKRNKKKYEIVGIGILDGVQVGLCGMKCVNLNNKTVKILDVYFRIIKILSKITVFPNILPK